MKTLRTRFITALVTVLIIAWVIFWSLMAVVHAAEVDCREVRTGVAQARAQGLTDKQIEAIARSAGATEEQIAAARSCLVHHHKEEK